jgi:hypothetical protein
MKKHLSNLILITLTGCILAGCASLTGVTNWKENTFESPHSKDATVKVNPSVSSMTMASFSRSSSNQCCGLQWNNLCV